MAPQILKSLTVAAGLLASVSLAAPAKTPVVEVWETVTDVVVETVVITKTVNGVPGAPKTIAPPPVPKEKSYQTHTVDAYPVDTPTTVAPGEFHSKPTTTATPQYEASPSPSPPPQTTTQQAPPPPPPSPSPPSPSPSPSPPPPPPAPPAPAPAPAPKPPTSPIVPLPVGGGGSCTKAAPCTGDFTFYDGGLGACGNQVDTYGEDAIALPFDLMGALSNKNPYCGQTVTISYNGVTHTAVVKDKCMGCYGGSIDMTRCLFEKFASEGQGRVSGVEWWFN
ncbi:hypothetical protein AJ79_01736 [Helicocarpus griseus UAMH5409]|uniref:RlpA-like protein double-psi beta-barrel domain-containing protein n=1 Tax=Helicocarpus griseus UAMH5409 TaxID=1447875 RepID=A0A2B7Y5D2_9EURO|nr:hypothetical protein AJ79_01736 [Helicocarpus griseus UAMH5409]